MLHKIAFRIKKYESHLSNIGEQNVQASNRKNIKVYVNDMMVKTKVTRDHIFDLGEVFSII